MTDIILHHYLMSTFSEKVRLALGLKGLSYREVITPPVMPKPDLLPLTGGYRRAPVLQVGADVYCDTQLILRTLECCRGNRTSASGILGISVRTMRNKLKAFVDAGIPVVPAA